MKYKYITIDNRTLEMFEKHPIYRIYNNKSGSELGFICWYKPWKQYVFSSQPECVFNNSCIRNILSFMEYLREEEKGGA